MNFYLLQRSAIWSNTSQYLFFFPSFLAVWPVIFCSSGLPEGTIQLRAARLFESFVILLPINNIIVLSSYLNKGSVGFQRWWKGAFSSSLSNLHAQVVQGQWGLNKHLLKLQECAVTSSSLCLQLRHRTIPSLQQPFPSAFPFWYPVATYTKAVLYDDAFLGESGDPQVRRVKGNCSLALHVSFPTGVGRSHIAISQPSGGQWVDGHSKSRTVQGCEQQSTKLDLQVLCYWSGSIHI